MNSFLKNKNPNNTSIPAPTPTRTSIVNTKNSLKVNVRVKETKKLYENKLNISYGIVVVLECVYAGKRIPTYEYKIAIVNTTT